ncbi:Chlororespiratory reduction 6 [Hibiscus syriacus]|uniref:Chlororespiratory reduction 6 n=1 Tax=Hibiscus syriacus TaxID=106335 RepID=A0A6A3CFG3_HIBSY|nr:Chlororespiratory reduction 6 [Hibiscus syriacus]
MEGVLTETHLANLTRVDSFILTTYPNRSLIFNVNQDWAPPFRLKTLVLINCLVGLYFPVWLQVQTHLSYVILSNAGISDTIEEEWFARLFSNSWYVDLSNNSINAKLPLEVHSERLDVVDLSRNRFEGYNPLWLTNATDVYLQRNSFSDLSNNNLIGSIPKCFHNFTALKYGNATLDYEYLFEVQDNTIGEQTMLVGTKGRELEYSKTFLKMKNIDLSRNKLTGEFPIGLCNLAFLDTLNLSRNHLSGNISDNIGDLRWLKSLDLSFNKFSGPIPRSLSSLTLLNHLNLSYNNLSGRIPTGNQLQTLNDSSNYEGNPFLCGFPFQQAVQEKPSLLPHHILEMVMIRKTSCFSILALLWDSLWDFGVFVVPWF